jgi:peroxisome-assembly ATPase
MKRAATSSVAITDPLVKYRSLLATGLYAPDPAQHRLAIHLQQIYHRLKDYTPAAEYRARLETIRTALQDPKPSEQAKPDGSAILAAERHPIRRNPFFARFFAQTEPRDSLALTRVFTSYEAAIDINSPQGLFLSGEVGTGKSMLLDLLADGLPTSRKKRWHFNTFMLYTLSQLERYRKSHAQLSYDDQHYSLLWMAKELIEKSPILFLDEFQLPDRAASKILSSLFTVFFQLGGVLVASSNRMPEELEKATGYEVVHATSGGFIGRALGLRPAKGKGDLFGSSSDFSSFLEVLKARCEFWQMEGGKDWRRREADEEPSYQGLILPDTAGGISSVDVLAEPGNTLHELESTSGPGSGEKTPRNYFLPQSADGKSWDQALAALIGSCERPIPWAASTLTVYGRNVTIRRQHNGVAYWDFTELVSEYGPADYITMASTFHTFAVDEVPILTISKKNEARRLITFLDALYEARCKLIVRAQVGPDDLFFPEAKRAQTSGSTSELPGSVDSDAIHSETIAEVFQDQTSPFRPNISSYVDPASTPYDPDQDSDFGVSQQSPRLKPDFSDTGAFTGEDERFAYKRATSRLWELCGMRWHARTGDWWCPLPAESRHWEGGPGSKPLDGTLFKERGERGVETTGESVELDEPAGLERFRLGKLKEAIAGEQGEKMEK